MIMYNLTDEQIWKVDDYFHNVFDFDESEKIGKTEAELRKLYYPSLGDAPFTFNDVFITNPLIDDYGNYLGSYERACEYYSKELVNNFYGELLKHWGEEVDDDSDVILESAIDRKISDKPIYKDNDVTIYNFKDLDKLNELVKDEIDIGVTGGNFLLISAADTIDDDFVAEGEDIYVVDLESGSCWNNANGESIDDLRNYVLSAKAWAVIDDLLKNETLYASCDLKDKNYDATFSADIEWNDLKDNFAEVKSNSRVETISGTVALDVLNYDYQPNIYYEEDFIDNVVDDISDKNLTALSQQFDIPKEDIKSILKSSTPSDGDKQDACYRVVNDALYRSLFDSEISNLLEDIIKGIKDCFTAEFNQYVEYDSDGMHIKNCPKQVLSKLMDKYIEQQDQYDWLENIYSQTNLSALIGGLIALNLFIKERYSYQDYDKDTFNEFLEMCISEL